MLAARVIARKAQNKCTATAGHTRIDDLFDFTGMSRTLWRLARSPVVIAAAGCELPLKDYLFAGHDSMKRKRRPVGLGTPVQPPRLSITAP